MSKPSRTVQRGSTSKERKRRTALGFSSEHISVKYRVEPVTKYALLRHESGRTKGGSGYVSGGCVGEFATLKQAADIAKILKAKKL